MCGIFFSVSATGPVDPTLETCSLLRNRGPDSFQEHTLHQDVAIGCPETHRTRPVALTFVSTVLSMRGASVLSQPIVDTTSHSVLCWNGDAWRITGERIQGNDAELIFHLLLQAASPSSDASGRSQASVQRVADVISSISGAFAFVFYDAVNSRLYFGRDCLGRRSLLQGFDASGAFKVCSLCDGTSTNLEEVDTNGVHMIDLTHDIFQVHPEVPTADTNATSFNQNSIQTLPWERTESSTPHLVCCLSPFAKQILTKHAEKSHPIDEQISPSIHPTSAEYRISCSQITRGEAPRIPRGENPKRSRASRILG